MAPPPLPTRHYGPTITSRQVTEDTPPDLLEGTMDLQVTLPSGKSIIMNVHRSTPMMDLLVQVTTAHRINPGGHIIQVVSDNIFLSYKPSTPIGQLDTSAIKIVPKNKLKDAVRNRKSNLQQQAIERNIRLKPKEWVYKQQIVVNLPRNQLAVYRVPPRTLISDILSMVCKEKNLDEEAFEIRHPVNVDERLRGSCALSDYQLQEVCVVSRDFRPPPLSVTDLITMASIAHPDDKKRRGFLGGIFSRKAKSSTGDSSVSSGSAGERSVSPARSDESMDGRPAPRALSPAAATSATLPNHTSRIRTNVAGGLSSARLSRPVSMISLSKTKKGPAPVPPLKKSVSNFNGNVQPIKESKVSLSRHSSDSSGYHEPETKSSHASPSNSVVGTLEALSKSTPKSNLPHVSSQSMSSIASSKCKRRAPPPPTMANKAPPLAIPEEDMDNSRNISNLSIASTECSNSVETLRNYPVASREMLNSSESSVDPSDASNKEETVVISDNIKDSSTDNSPTNSKENTLKMSKDSNSGTESVENVSRCDDSKISSLNNSEGSCSKSLSDSHTSSETVTDSPFEEVMKDLSSEKINNRCSDIVVSSAVELSNGISPESSNNASLEKVQSDNNRASPYSTSIPSPDTSAIIDTSAIELPVNSPNTSVESPKVDCEEDPSVGIDSNSRQLPCSTSENSNSSTSAILHSPRSQLALTTSKPKSLLRNLNGMNVTSPSNSNQLRQCQPIPSVSPTSPTKILNEYVKPKRMTKIDTIDNNLFVNKASSNRLSESKSRKSPHQLQDDQLVPYFNSNLSEKDNKNLSESSFNDEQLSKLSGPQVATCDESDPNPTSDNKNNKLDHDIGSETASQLTGKENMNDLNMESMNSDNLLQFHSSSSLPRKASLPDKSTTDESVPMTADDRAACPVPVPRKKWNTGPLIRSDLPFDTFATKEYLRNKSNPKIINDFKLKLLGKHSILKNSKVSHNENAHLDLNTDQASKGSLTNTSKDSNSFILQKDPQIKSWKTTDLLHLLNDEQEYIKEPSIPSPRPVILNSGKRKGAKSSLASNSSLCSDSDNEVQTQKLSLSSETGHEYVELLNDLQRPKRQKKHRAKIPEDFAECSGDGRIYKSAEETEKSLASECEPLTNDLPVTDCLAALCDTSEPTMANTEDTYSGNMCSKTVLNGPSDNPPPLFSSSSDDFQDILNKKNSELAPTFDSDEEDSFDVNGIIEVAQLSDDTINILSEDVPDNIQSNAVNMLPEFIDEKLNVSEAFNLDVHKQIQTKDENFSNDDLCAGMYVEFPKQEESSTDPSTQTLERRKNNFTSKVELSSENDERLGLVKTPVQRSISITQISASSEERKIKEEYVKNDVISELKSNIEAASSNHSPKILTLKPKSTSDYKVVLSYNNSSSQPASLIDKRMERTDSNSSYESVSSVSNAQIKSDILVKCDRSSTETSYESAPPPLPESHVPMFSDSESKGSRSSSVSRQSSLSECDKSDFKKPQRPSGPPQPVFSISTYASRAEKISYDKKLVRSESLMSIDDIHNKKPTCVSEDSNPSKAKDDFLNRRLGRTDSKRNDFFRSEEALNKNFVLHRIMPESSKQPVLSVNCDRSKSGTNSPTVPVKSLATELDNSDHHHVQDTFRSRRSAFEQKPSPSSRHPEPIKFELGSAKDSITFSNRVVRNPTSFYLRKAKSTLDMRGAGPAADNKYGDGVAYPSGGEPALAQEYMKLQDDFMKWQQQLLQNQHVLHSKVAPIASNPPTLNNFGKGASRGGLKLGWKSPAQWMTKEMGPPISQGPPQPKKPVEITIPIRFEDTGEIVGSTNETHIISRSSQENQMPTQQYSNARPAYSQFSNHSWNNPGMNIGTWEQRPAEREKEPSPTNQQSNFVNSGSRPFNRTQFAPANSGPTSGMQTVFQSTPAQLHDNRFRYQEYPEQQTLFQGAPEPPGRFQEMSQPRYQNSFQPKFQAAPDPQMRFQEAQQPRFTKEISPPRFQELPPLRYQEAPQTRYQPAPQNVTESTPQYSTRPQDFSAQNRPQMPYINGPAHSNSNNQASDKNDDNINARFTSVVTLSNDKTGDNAPKKDKVRSVVQLNNVDSEPLQGSSMFRGGPVVKGFQIKTEPQILNNEREKRSPPICSVTPMSSRLVQQAVLQPEAANSGGFRISPPRFERKSPSPPKVEQSPPPFSNVTLRHVEPRVSPPRASPLRISPPREPSPAISVPQQAISPPPAPPMNIPPPPPPSSGIPPPPPPREGSEERRTSAGKRIMSANNVPQLDAREELMMAIRQFGGSSGKLRRSPNPFN